MQEENWPHPHPHPHPWPQPTPDPTPTPAPNPTPGPISHGNFGVITVISASSITIDDFQSSQQVTFQITAGTVVKIDHVVSLATSLLVGQLCKISADATGNAIEIDAKSRP